MKNRKNVMKFQNKCQSFQVMIGEDKILRFSGVALGEACTIVIRGATQQILDEAERSLHDALCVLTSTVRESRIVYGGGNSEMVMSCAVMKEAAATPGKEAMAMEAFARALQQLPTVIADNAGYDSAQLISKLRAAHNSGTFTMGLGLLRFIFIRKTTFKLALDFQIRIILFIYEMFTILTFTFDVSQ
jgi:T-complex protein 1 subunit beta